MAKSGGNIIWLVGLVGFGLLLPGDALALQVHGEPEGL